MFKFFLYFFFLLNSLSVSYTLNRDMVLIPSGEYIPLFKGSGSDYKIHVDSFLIDRYPVTNFDFKKFLLSDSSWNIDFVPYILADKNYLNHWRSSRFEDIVDHPVVNVSWFAANSYCNFFGGRLPTIDEWEYVASAGEYSPAGIDEINYLQNILDWYINSQTFDLVSIYDMHKNYWNVFGMHGVIWEWVYDFNSVLLLNTDAEGGGLEEMLFCGATATNAINPLDYVAFMRFAFRNTLEANYTSSNLGFRCVKNVD